MQTNPSSFLDDLQLHYDFFAPARIAFGWGRRSECGNLARSLGRRALLVCGSRSLQATGVLDELADCLQRADVEAVPLVTITHEPEVSDVDEAVGLLLQHDVGEHDLILAVGGGSAIDLAKAVAALATNRRSDTVRDYLEGVGQGLQIEVPPLPLMVMPTTAGTGSEATKNAVISSFDPPFKKSLRSELMVPRLVLIDPELSVSACKEVTAATGMDALTQLIESFISRRAKPIPQALCRQGLQLAARCLVEAVENGTSQPGREGMAQAALLSGMALANSGLGMAHGVAAALGVHCRVTHGLACAVMLPAAMQVNADVRQAELAEVGTILTSRNWPTNSAAVEAGIERVKQISSQIGIPNRLTDIGVQADQIPAIVHSSRGNSMNGNPRELTDEELTRILEEMF